MMVKCSQCGREVALLEGQKFCSFCGAVLSLEKGADSRDSHELESGPARAESPLSATIPVAEQRTGYVPWEDQENQGFLEGLLLTVRQSLFAPGAFFSRMPTAGGLLNPLLYGLLLETLGTIAGYAWGLALDHPLLSYGQLTGSAAVVIGLMIPFIVVVRLLLWAGLLHASLRLLQGATKEFEATFRVVCYSCGPQLCNAVPLIGGVAAMFWTLYISVVGLREVHRTTSWRAMAAVFLPFFLCCGTLAGTVGLIAMLDGLGG
jgi:hypothetical protein